MAKVYHQEIFGLREEKYDWLKSHSISNVEWKEIEPQSEFYLFKPLDTKYYEEYQSFMKVTDIFIENSVGVVTARDEFVIDYNINQLKNRIKQFLNINIDNSIIKTTYKLREKDNWKIKEIREKILKDDNLQNEFAQILYRPFDIRWIFYNDDIIERPRKQVMKNMFSENIGLITIRHSRSPNLWNLAFVSNQIIAGATAVTSLDINYFFPLYLYPNIDTKNFTLENIEQNAGEKIPNINPELFRKLKKQFTPSPLTPLPKGEGNRKSPLPLGEDLGEGGEDLGEGGKPHKSAPPILLQRARELRKNPTTAEAFLWELLRNKQLNGLKFRRQHPYEKFILDFYCFEANLCIELDGGIHTTKEQQEYDKIRTKYFALSNIKVLRFTNEEVIYNTEYVLQKILEDAILPSPLTPLPKVVGEEPSPLTPLPMGEGNRKSPLPLGEDLGEGINITPESIFYYVYAVLYSNIYREKYKEFLKIDFPRIPFTKDYEQFITLGKLGERLANIHLLKSTELENVISKFPIEGNCKVEKVVWEAPSPLTPLPKVVGEEPSPLTPLPMGEGNKESPLPMGEDLGEGGKVYINKEQYFDGIKEDVWKYHIGGYQVCDKWLKDRKGRTLSLEEIKTYCKIVTALAKTIEIQSEIDEVYE
ncbi:MAG TPA: DUF559 domain-containing protein [Candidatus Kapabacteria bacterium]|nr:DUF559 domain-containing protein [Candidatus Kapabacteria bacterium]